MTLFASVNALFGEVRTLTQTINHSEAQKIADQWRKRTLNDDLDRRIRGEYDLNLQDSKSVIEGNLRKMQLQAAERLVTTVTREAELNIDANSESWRRLAFHLMRAQLLASDEIERRERSAHRDTIYYDLGEESPKAGLKLSQIFEKWVGATDRVARTVTDWRYAIRRFIELHGDKEVGSITKSDVRAFRDACLKIPKRLPQDDRDLPIQDLLAKYRDTAADRIDPKTAIKYITAGDVPKLVKTGGGSCWVGFVVGWVKGSCQCRWSCCSPGAS
jgi:hypothetical protein